MEIPEGISTGVDILNIIKFASNFDLHVVMAKYGRLPSESIGRHQRLRTVHRRARRLGRLLCANGWDGCTANTMVLRAR